MVDIGAAIFKESGSLACVTVGMGAAGLVGTGGIGAAGTAGKADDRCIAGTETCGGWVGWTSDSA